MIIPTFGKVVSVNSSHKKGIVKTPLTQGIFIEAYGLQDDAHAGVPIRQVSLLAMESIRKMEAQLKRTLPYGSFAENLTIEGLELHTLPIGTKLQIGDTIQQVSKIGKECHTGCEIGRTVGRCIMPIEGIFTIVLQGGLVKAGDSIRCIQ